MVPVVPVDMVTLFHPCVRLTRIVLLPAETGPPCPPGPVGPPGPTAVPRSPVENIQFPGEARVTVTFTDALLPASHLEFILSISAVFVATLIESILIGST